MSILKTTTASDAPLDASTGDTKGRQVSDFLTIQSLSNFAVVSVVIKMAWATLAGIDPVFAGRWVVYTLAALWGTFSIATSIDGLRNDGKELQYGTLFGAIFIAIVNSIVLVSAATGLGQLPDDLP